MTTTVKRWTSADLEALPDDGNRYEIIDGELYVSTQPHWRHQRVCARATTLLELWSDDSGNGMVLVSPGLICADDDDVAPDVVWISNAQLATALWADGKLHASPELVIEVLSPGAANERRDREIKLNLYSRRGASEYWIIDWRRRQVEVYRQHEEELRLIGTLSESDVLDTPLLQGFSCSVADLFKGIPKEQPGE